MNVICYKRVSTDDQADRGFSLQHQEVMLRSYCTINHHTIVGIYTEDFSAKTFDRPEWNKIIAYVKKNKNKVDLILCLKWDRFSRNQYDALTTIKEFQKMGVNIDTVEQPLDLTNPDNKMLLSVYLTIPEVENDKNSRRTTDGMRRAQFEGCWTGFRPRGYNNARDGHRSTLVPNQDAPLIRQAFERMATGSYSSEEVRRWIIGQGIPFAKQSFLDALRNPVYTGKILIKEYGNQPEQIVMGIHPALITEELFYRANEALNGRKRKMKFHENKADIYPLKGFLICPTHGTSLTAYGCKGRNGDIYHYYVCTKCTGTQRHPIGEAHQSMEDILSKISLTAQTVSLYRKTLEKLFDKEDIGRKDELAKTEKEIEKQNDRLKKLQDQLLDGHITPQDYHTMKQRVENDLMGLQCKRTDLQSGQSPFKEYIKHTVPMLENLVPYYRNADGQTKKKILGCIFAKKIVLEKGRVKNYEFTESIRVLLHAGKVLAKTKNKKEFNNELLGCLVSTEGEKP